MGEHDQSQMAVQAQVQAEALRAVIDENLATKQDIESLRRDMKEIDAAQKGNIESLRRDTKEMETRLLLKMELMRRDTIIWLGGMIVVATTALGVLSERQCRWNDTASFLRNPYPVASNAGANFPATGICAPDAPSSRKTPSSRCRRRRKRIPNARAWPLGSPDRRFEVWRPGTCEPSARRCALLPRVGQP